MKNTLTKILASLGTALVWFPLLAPVLLSALALITDGELRFDYLMPAELSPFGLGGGLVLVWAALRARSRQWLIVGSVIAAIILLAGVMAVPAITGLASGGVAPESWQWALVIALLIGYALALAVVGVGGVLLLRDVFQPFPPKRV